MKNVEVVFVLSAFMLTGCECDENLQRICPEPQPCFVFEGQSNIEENILLGVALDSVNTQGACSLGMTACNDDLSLYCDGHVYPEEEMCDFVDNDCDGETDEDFDNDSDGYTQCNGDCDDDNKDIRPNRPEECNGIDDNCDGVIPNNEVTDADGDGAVECYDCDDTNINVAPNNREICDNIDNDCDEEIDEDILEEWQACGPPSSSGVCEMGEQICLDGELYCIDAIYPSGEVCNNLDDDCDGLTDEGLSQECTSICGVGIEYCLEGNWIGCSAPQPTEEICDGIDNNCDGQIDEGCSCPEGAVELCSGGTIDSETGELLDCGLGLKECDADGLWGPCMFIMPVTEECNNYDDDCDGIIDGLTDSCSANDESYELIGECSLGTTTCEEGVWGECEGAQGPLTEVCNDLDDDCDGDIDENLNAHENVDMVFMIDGSGSMCQYVTALAQGIGQYVSDFEETEHRFALVIFPFEVNAFGADYPWVLVTDLVEVNQFIATLNSIACTYPSDEPSYDTMHDLADPYNPVGISWRSDAYPYLIMMTDEAAQTWAGFSEYHVAQMVSDCQVGECVTGDNFETYVFTSPTYFYGWDEICYFDNSRLISIQPPDAEEYANKLRSVFTNVCL
jgi:hypothetical protein